MKKNTNTIIAEAKKLSSRMPKTINESLNFNGMPREDGYDITVASEIMAVLCLASDINDLKARLGRIIGG